MYAPQGMKKTAFCVFSVFMAIFQGRLSDLQEPKGFLAEQRLLDDLSSHVALCYPLSATLWYDNYH